MTSDSKGMNKIAYTVQTTFYRPEVQARICIYTGNIHTQYNTNDVLF